MVSTYKQVLAVGALALCVTVPARADTTLVMNVVMPRASAFVVGGQQPWKEQIERGSNGRIKIDMPAATLAPPTRQWDMVTSGIADITLTINDYIRDRAKLPFLAEIPFVAPNGVAASVAIWRTYEKYFKAADEYKGVKLLGLWVNGGNTLQTLKKPVLKLADFQGLKIYSATPNISKALSNFGATPVSQQNSNMYEMMSGGIVDGAVTGKASLISFQLIRYTKEITYFSGQLGYTIYSFFMNEKKYNSLSAEDRAVIDKYSYEAFSRMAAQGFVDADNQADAQIAPNGIHTHQASPEFIKAVKEKVTFFKDDWMADAKSRGVDGPAAYDFYEKTALESASLAK